MIALLLLLGCARPAVVAPVLPPSIEWTCTRIDLSYGPTLSCVGREDDGRVVRCIVPDPDEGPASCVAAVGGGR